jgi:dienelactone hydrolase
MSYELLDHLRLGLQMHVLCVEYPGYGVYEGSPSSHQILEDADNVFNYIVRDLLWNPKNIILFGRSIGSGPATWLAANKNPGGLLLMSAYTSIRAVVSHLAGTIPSLLIKDRFSNIDLMPRVTCPTFIVHG